MRQDSSSLGNNYVPKILCKLYKTEVHQSQAKSAWNDV